MKYFIDLDNTLCYTQSNDYKNSKPNVERINYLRDLKDNGHHITIWTARGSSTGMDHAELTKIQLSEWNVPYDELVMGKPSYDCCIDDKSFNVDDYCFESYKKRFASQISEEELRKVFDQNKKPRNAAYMQQLVFDRLIEMNEKK